MGGDDSIDLRGALAQQRGGVELVMHDPSFLQPDVWRSDLEAGRPVLDAMNIRPIPTAGHR